jgi:hypothetical protein
MKFDALYPGADLRFYVENLEEIEALVRFKKEVEKTLPVAVAEMVGNAQQGMIDRAPATSPLRCLCVSVQDDTSKHARSWRLPSTFQRRASINQEFRIFENPARRQRTHVLGSQHKGCQCPRLLSASPYASVA